MTRDEAVRDASTEHVEAEHWRALAEQRSDELRRLKRRPMVRAALAVDWRVEPVRRAVARARAPGRRVRDRAQLLLGAAMHPRASRRRAAALASAVSSVPAVDHDERNIVVVSIDDVARAPGERPLAALARAAATESADLLCFVVGPAVPLEPAWTARLAAAVRGTTVAATPTLIHPDRPTWHATEHDLLVRAQGFETSLDATATPVVSARGAGTVPDPTAADTEVQGASLQCLVVDRGAFVAAGGLSAAVDDPDVAGLDLCLRLRRRGGHVTHVAAAMVTDARPVARRASLRNPIDPSGSAWAALVDRHGPMVVRPVTPPPGGASRDRRARWAIVTAAPSRKVAHRWGDWHLAVALADGLRRAGHDALVETFDHAGSSAVRCCDVLVALRGLEPVAPSAGQRHVVWVISHPETISAAECDEADLVVAASPRFAEHLRTITGTPVEVLLQATDPNRFSPGPVDPTFRHPVTVVAKARNAPRPAVAAALAAGIRPAIYGSGWDGLVDPDLVIRDHVANEELPRVYRSAGVVLNDHWDTMRAWGFVSNRVFDVLACATPVISDDLHEVTELFGEAVPIYHSSADLGELIRKVLDDPIAAKALAARGRAVVLEHHTFDVRARQIVEHARRHGLLPAR